MFSVLDFNEPLVFPPNVAPGPVQAEAEFVMLNDQIGQVDALDSSFLSLDGLSFCDPRALHLPPTDSVSNQPLTPTEQDSFANVNFHHHHPDNYTLVSFDFLGQLVGQVNQPVGQNCQTYEASCSPSTLLPTDHALPHASPLSPPVSPLMRDSSQMSVDMFVGFDADSCAHHTAGRSSSTPARPVKTKQEVKRADKPVEKSTRAVGRPVELPPSPVFESRTRSISVSSESTISIKSEPDVPSPPSLVASKGAGVGKVQKKRQVRNGRSANSCSMKSVPEQYAAGKAVKKAVKRGRKAPTNDDQDASKIFVCDQCDRRFRRQEHLKRHHRSLHTQEKPYACDQCSKRFSRSDNLSQHERTHREERKMAASASSSDDEDQE